MLLQTNIRMMKDEGSIKWCWLLVCFAVLFVLFFFHHLHNEIFGFWHSWSPTPTHLDPAMCSDTDLMPDLSFPITVICYIYCQEFLLFLIIIYH